MKINPYLCFNGNTEDAFNFYKSVFGGELQLMRFKGSPGCENMKPEDQEKVLHVALDIGNGQMLMASDYIEGMPNPFVAGNNVQLSLHPESKEEAERVFSALSAGGKIDMELQDTFWNAYYGSFTDRFGIQWLVNYQYPNT